MFSLSLSLSLSLPLSLIILTRYFNVNEFAFVTFMYSHALIPAPAYEAARVACGWETFLSDCEKDFTHPTKSCVAATQKAVQYIPSPLDPYKVLVKTCHKSSSSSSPFADPAAADKFVSEYTPHLDAMRKKYGLDIEYNPCISTYVMTRSGGREGEEGGWRGGGARGGEACALQL